MNKDQERALGKFQSLKVDFTLESGLSVLLSGDFDCIYNCKWDRMDVVVFLINIHDSLSMQKIIFLCELNQQL